MLSAAFLLLAILSTVSCVKRTGFLSPASLSCTFTLVSMGAFFWAVANPYADDMGGLSFEIDNYEDVAPTVFAVYGVLAALTNLAVVGVRRAVTPPASQALKVRFIRDLTSRLLMRVAFVLAAISLVEVAALAIFGLTSQTGDVIVTALSGALGAMTACAITFGFERRRLLSFALMPVFAVHFSLMLVTYSRWTSVICALIAMLIVNRRLTDGKRPFSLGVVVMIAVTVWMHLFALQGRVDRGNTDVSLVVQHLTDVSLNANSLFGMSINVFLGPLGLAEVLRIRTPPYDPLYALLSFSPMPSFIDGWKAIEPLAFRVNIFTPYTAFGELLNFGFFYIALFAAVYGTCIRVLTKVYLSIGFEVGFLATSPALYPILAFHQYPIRNCLRLFTYSTLLAYALWRFAEKRFRIHQSRSHLTN